MPLDASKAFDRVEYVKLDKLFIKKGLCLVIVRVLDSWNMSSVKVKWGLYVSSKITVSNWVKQGVIISLILFVSCMNELCLSLKKSGQDCYTGDVSAMLMFH